MTQAVWTTFCKMNGVVVNVHGSDTQLEARAVAKRYKADNETMTVVVERSNRIKAKRLMEAHHRYLAARAEMVRMAEARTRKGRMAMKVRKPATLTFAFM